MPTYTYEQILEQLPDCERLFEFREVSHDTPPMEIRYTSNCESDSIRSSFIPPNLPVVEMGSRPSTPQIFIISAPGNVGKSTLSKSLADAKDAILYDLASAQPVGGASFSGVLQDAMGGENSDAFGEYLSEGLQFVIVDALDEGRLKVTEDAFISFLENIRNRAQDAKGVCFVLLGRTQRAEEAWVILDGERSGARLLTIEPFNRSQADEYINSRVEEKIRTPVFDDCRELIFQQLAFSTGVSSGDESREFLHYPPVLDVIVELLAEETNLQSLRNDLQSEADTLGDESVGLLQNVIRRILEREQKKKLLPTIRPKFDERAAQLGWSDWESLYSIPEQCNRILGKVLGVSITATPQTLPNEFTRDYEESVDEWLPQHPFLQGIDRFANSVFQSYLYARALRGDFGDELRLQTAKELLDPQKFGARTRLLAEFYLNESTVGHDEIQEVLPEHLGILYDSLLSSETTKSYLHLTIDGDDPAGDDFPETENRVEGEFEFLTFSPSGELNSEPRPMSFYMQIDQDSVVSFTKSIRDCNITLPCSIRFGSSSVSEFEIGPAVYINSYQITFASESLKVGGRSRLRPNEEIDSSVILEAQSCDWTALLDRPTAYDRDRFFITWPDDDRFPWTEFPSASLQEDLSDDESLRVAFMRFKRIATAFRSHGQGALARTVRKIEHQRILQGALGEKLLSQLVSDEVLVKEGRLYRWNSVKADALLGVSWQDLKKGECPQTLRGYLTGFISNNSDLFV